MGKSHISIWFTPGQHARGRIEIHERKPGICAWDEQHAADVGAVGGDG